MRKLIFTALVGFFLQNVPEIRKINFFENMIGVSFLLVQPLELLAKFNGTLVLLSCSPECQWSVIQQDTSYLALQISLLCVKQIQLGEAILTFPDTPLTTQSNFLASNGS